MRPCAECGGLPSSPFTGLCTSCARAYADGSAYGEPVLTHTPGDRFDAIADRLDAAYAARRGAAVGSPARVLAELELEAVYADLRALNAEIGAGPP